MKAELMRWKRLAISCVLITLFAQIAMAGQMEDVKKTVAFVYVPDKQGKLVANGTGFFVAIPMQKKEGYSHIYFVTAKHVIQNEEKKFIPRVAVRMNLKSGTSSMEYLDVKVDGPDRSVYFHSDPSVDLAAMPCSIDINTVDGRFISHELITTKDGFQTLQIQEGSEVFFAGLFAPYAGDQRSYPIVRFGRVALITPERIPFRGQMTDLYLMDSASYGGNSGSPVFLRLIQEGAKPGSILLVGEPRLYLAGVMQGRFNDVQPIQIVETDRTALSISSAGIAAVVPAYKLHEILYSDELKRLRGE